MGRDELTGADGQQITDADLLEDQMESEPAEEGIEPERKPDVDSDLPEGLPAQEGERTSPEPARESEIDRLKRHNLHRPGMIETFDDLAKSYKNIEHFVSTTKRVEATAPPPQPMVDPQKVMEELQEEFIQNPVAATTKIANAVQYQVTQKIDAMESDFFYSANPDARKWQEEITTMRQAYPGMKIADAYNSVRGRHVDEIIAEREAKAVEATRRQETDKVLAQREKAGGIRTAQLTQEQKLNQAIRDARAKGLSGDALRQAMRDAIDDQAGEPA